MAYDEGLAERIRDALGDEREVVEKKMFGGLCFMVAGKMSVGIVKDDLMVRVGPERNDLALSQPHARPMDFSGRPMKGFLYVAPEGVESDERLACWVAQGVAFAHSASAAPKRARKVATKPAGKRKRT
jgi:TfoX/Sxy family transcriptional regulator of competence genes